MEVLLLVYANTGHVIWKRKLEQRGFGKKFEQVIYLTYMYSRYPNAVAAIDCVQLVTLNTLPFADLSYLPMLYLTTTMDNAVYVRRQVRETCIALFPLGGTCQALSLSVITSLPTKRVLFFCER